MVAAGEQPYGMTSPQRMQFLTAQPAGDPEQALRPFALAYMYVQLCTTGRRRRILLLGLIKLTRNRTACATAQPGSPRQARGHTGGDTAGLQ
jgi:hypothetical protein